MEGLMKIRPVTKVRDEGLKKLLFDEVRSGWNLDSKADSLF